MLESDTHCIEPAAGGRSPVNLSLTSLLNNAKEAVRNDATSAAARIDLASAMIVAGQWQSASNQLKIGSDLDPQFAMKAAFYRALINAEQYREAVFGGDQQPMCIGEPPQWLALLIESMKSANANSAAAAQVRASALDEAPISKGLLDGQAFAWIADADLRLGPVAELIIDGRYFWCPYEKIRRIEFCAPTNLVDLVWTPITITWMNEGSVRALMPSRYPVCLNGVQDEHRLSRRTDFIESDDGDFIVLGQKMLCTDNGEFPLLDMRLLDVNAEVLA